MNQLETESSTFAIIKSFHTNLFLLVILDTVNKVNRERSINKVRRGIQPSADGIKGGIEMSSSPMRIRKAIAITAALIEPANVTVSAR